MGKTVGIVTIPGNCSHGNKLQNYAVMRIYEALGFETETLECAKRSPLSACRHFAGNIVYSRSEASPEDVMSAERREAFSRFAKRIPTRSVTESLRELPSHYDLFSVGSDQVWNPRGIDCYQWMFLEFADKSQRIALSPSIGMSKIRSPYARTLMRRGLNGFNHLSVREDDGAAVIRDLTGRDAEVLIDPTLMIDAKAWLLLSDGRLVPNGDYVLSFVLGNQSDDQKAYLQGVLSEYGASLVKLSDRSREGEVDAGPAEFISLIANARHVVTDSFHAAVFSLLMGTPFTVFRRSGGSGSTMFSRLETLTRKFGAQHRIFGDESFTGFDGSVSSEAFSMALRDERKKFAAFLAKCIEGIDISSIADGVQGIS